MTFPGAENQIKFAYSRSFVYKMTKMTLCLNYLKSIFAVNSAKQNTMKYTLIFLLFLFASTSFAQNISREEYIRRYQLLAIEEMNRSGIPASITMAQGCLESGNGNSELAVLSNNHFGIKCKTGWRGPKVFYDDDRRNECFRKYNSVPS